MYEDKSPWRTDSRFDASNLKSWEWWLNKVGIALLLLGVAFFFKLSWDRGWLSPPLQLALGMAAGCGLLGLGLRLYGERRSFAQVLLGGGVGVLYTTGFAAYGLYEFVSYPIAFAFMVAATLLAFSLSIRQDEPSLSVIGTLGGLGTPFVLYTGAGNLGGLVIYACLVLSGAGAVYLYKGWRSLLYVSLISGWAVFLVGYWGGIHVAETSLEDRVALGTGVIFAWLLFWLVPVSREILHLKSPRQWPKPEPGPLLEESPLARAIIGEPNSARAMAWRVSAARVHLLSISTPLLALAFVRRIFELPGDSLGLVAGSMAALYAVAALMLRRLEGDREGAVFYTTGLVALLLATLGLVLILSGDVLFFAVAAEAALLHLVSRRLRDGLISAQAHLLSAIAASWLFFRIFDSLAGIGAEHAPFLNGEAAVNLSVIALLFGASRAVLPGYLGSIYCLVAHAALFVGLSAELSMLTEGSGYVILLWTLYAAVLHLFSRRSSNRWMEAAAHGLSGIVGVWLVGRLAVEAALLLLASPIGFEANDLVDLTVIGLAVGISRLYTSSPEASAYRLGAAGAFSLWLACELLPLASEDALLLFGWSVYAVALHLLAWRTGDVGLSVAGHLQFLAAGILFLGGLLFEPTQPGLMRVSSAEAVADLTFILLAAGASLVLRPGPLPLAYQISAHIGLLAFLWRELPVLPGGEACVTVSWGLYAVGLLVWGLRGDRSQLIWGGTTTLFLVVGKLFLVDLAQVEALWRVLLFLGFGALFLALSYYLRYLWRPEEPRTTPAPSPTEGGRP